VSYLAPTLLVVAAAACRDKAPPPAPAPAPTSPPAVAAAPLDATAIAVDAAASDEPRAWYRATLLAKDKTETSFLLGLPPAGGASVIFRSGTHDVRVPATREANRLSVPLPVHSTTLDVTLNAEGTSGTGTFASTSKVFGTGSLPVALTALDAPSTKALATVPAGTPLDLGEPTTVWRVALSERGTARLEVHQLEPGVFEATMLAETGKYDYVAGTGAGNSMVLTGFDGTSGYRLALTLAPDKKSAKGSWSLGYQVDWKQTATAKRGPDFVLKLKNEATTGRPVKLPDMPELAALAAPGKPLVVELAGSWCSTCRNAAPHLVELAKEWRPKGVEFVTLLYEFSDDPAADDIQAKAFRDAYGITWPVIPVPGTQSDYSEIIPQGMGTLDPDGFPITLFVRADRTLAAAHIGFPASDAARSEYDHAMAEMRAHLEAITAP